MTLRHPIEVAVWANEEGGLFGSRAVSGQFEEAELAHVTSSGKTVRDGISFIGGDPARLGEARRPAAASPRTSNSTSNRAASSRRSRCRLASSRASSASGNGT